MSHRRVRSLALAVLALPAAALVLASCAGADQEGSAAHQMSVWVSGTGFGQDIGTLIADNARVPEDVANGTGAIHAACGTLLNDAEMANTELPSPDPTVTDLLTRAYGLEGTAANDCYGAGTTNKELLSTSYRDGVKAQALYREALERIRAIDGRLPTTTTTTDNADGGIFG